METSSREVRGRRDEPWELNGDGNELQGGGRGDENEFQGGERGRGGTLGVARGGFKGVIRA